MRTTAIILLAFLCAACASTPEDGLVVAPRPKDCFHASAVNGFAVVDRDTIRVSVGKSYQYEIDVAGAGCMGLRTQPALALDTGASGDWICASRPVAGARILYDDPLTGVNECRILAVRAVAVPPDGDEVKIITEETYEK